MNLLRPIECADPQDLPPPPPPPVWVPKSYAKDRFEVVNQIIREICKDPKYDNIDHMTSLIVTLSPDIDTTTQERLRFHYRLPQTLTGRDLIKHIVTFLSK